ncbi:hypothetical protein [Stratiformator vulcanicus]|uniref:Uncharacterized protein n=1 Tax=Stratiformator vulcanicus TaxID=2527980 RepID=A0A517R3L2_9PLAN|nr:hypothetical protein [Stratiformator vulcanicus]QDT38430.1 hypothetical protein Pan189_28240 [Stratiformator vulcanicus]
MSAALFVETEQRVDTEIDAIEEMRLRTWARKNFVESAERDTEWHPVILDEMAQMDRELQGV